MCWSLTGSCDAVAPGFSSILLRVSASEPAVMPDHRTPLFAVGNPRLSEEPRFNLRTAVVPALQSSGGPLSLIPGPPPHGSGCIPIRLRGLAAVSPEFPSRPAGRRETSPSWRVKRPSGSRLSFPFASCVVQLIFLSLKGREEAQSGAPSLPRADHACGASGIPPRTRAGRHRRS
jgi:hypothetical protein